MRRTELGHLLLTRWVVVLVCLALLYWQPLALAAVAHVQTTKTTDNVASTTTTSGSITLTAGNLLAACIPYLPPGSETISSVQLDGSTSFTSVLSIKLDTTSGAAVYYLANVAGGSHTVTVTYSGAVTYDTIYLTEISGAKRTSPVDGAGASATGGSTTPASGNYTTLGSSFAYGCIYDVNTTTFTAGSGWTSPSSDLTGTPGSGVEYKAAPGTTTQNADATGDNVAWAAVGVAFLSDNTCKTLAILGVGC